MDLGFHVVDRVRRFNLQGDGLAGQGLDEDLHTFFLKKESWLKVLIPFSFKYKMRVQLVVFYTFFLALYAQRGDVESKQTDLKNCKCKCECTLPAPCKLDFILVLENSGMVAEAFGSMKLRMDELARKVDKIYPIGTDSRFSVITYSDQANVDIPFTSVNSYSQFSRQLSELDFNERAAFLNLGMDTLDAYYNSQSLKNRDTIVILVTNGKSDDSVDENLLAEQIANITAKVNSKFYVNTVHKFSAMNSFEVADQDCTACDYNRKLFNDAGISSENILSFC